MKWNKKFNLTTKIAYIAGFVDGEGCIRIKHSNKQGNSYYVTVTISCNSREALEFIEGGFGGKIYTKERGYQYYLASGGAIDFLKCIRNYLIIKAKEADLAIEFYILYGYIDAVTKQNYYNDMRKLKVNKNKELLDERDNSS